MEQARQLMKQRKPSKVTRVSVSLKVNGPNGEQDLQEFLRSNPNVSLNGKKPKSHEKT